MEKKLANTTNFITALLMFFLPLSMAIPNILLVLIIVLFILQRKNSIWFSNYIGVAFAFGCISLFKDILLTEQPNDITEYKFSLLLIFVLVVGINIHNYIWLEIGFVLGTLSAVFRAIYRIVNYCFLNDVIPFGNTSGINELIIIDRPYIGFMCVISIIFLSKFMKLRKNVRTNVLFTLCQIILVTFIYLITARLALMMICYYFIRIVFKKRNFKKIKTWGVCIFCLGLIFLLGNKNIKERFYVGGSIKTTVNKLKDYEPRFTIWKCGFEQQKFDSFSLLFGFSEIKEVQKNLLQCYYEIIDKKSKRDYYLKMNFNMHNQFLDVFLKNGLLGLSLFLCLCFFWFFKKKLSFEQRIVIFFTIIFLTIENLLNRQLGTYLLIFLIPFKYKKEDKQ